MLDDRHGRRTGGVELGDAFIGRVGVVEVVVRQRLALDLPRRGDPGAGGARRAVEGGGLVRVLAVAQALCEVAAESPERCRAGGLDMPRHPVGDRRIVGRGAGIGLLREPAAERTGERAAALRQRIEHGGVIGDVGHDGDVGVVLGRRPDHRRAADVDVLDAVAVAAPSARVASNG